MNILDNDLYKFTMWNIVSQLYPNVQVDYKEIDRKNQLGYDFNFYDIFKSIQTYLNNSLVKKWSDDIQAKVNLFAQTFPNLNIPELESNYLSTIRNLKYWKNQILFEVPFLYTHSEKYYKKHLDSRFLEQDSILASTLSKLQRLNSIGKYYNRKVIFSELGTRRRISHNYQDSVLSIIKEQINNFEFLEFKGTSNVWFGLKHDIPIVGTMAHEWVMAHSALNSIQHANYYALKTWMDFYPNKFKVALTDTYGVNNFLRNMNNDLYDHFDTLRHDSGNPIDFIRKILLKYNNFSGKKFPTLLFSDSVNDGIVESVFKYLKDNALDVNVEFGIGTWFTAKPYDNFETLNIVLKLDKVNNISVCKLSDEPGKESGDSEMIDLTKKVLKYYGDLI